MTIPLRPVRLKGSMFHSTVIYLVALTILGQYQEYKHCSQSWLMGHLNYLAWVGNIKPWFNRKSASWHLNGWPLRRLLRYQSIRGHDTDLFITNMGFNMETSYIIRNSISLVHISYCDEIKFSSTSARLGVGLGDMNLALSLIFSQLS